MFLGFIVKVLIQQLKYCILYYDLLRNSLNDKSVGTVDNQHRNYWIDVTKAIRHGTNKIVVAFANPAA